ncbi:single-stranded DNA-binding protein [Paenarthrobacter sp. NPDC018779]|uniref:single-stranded DNA-binding protein n=1 Tax=Paenarthrobacter sp. NPDC018779 TaxID=3364375 RepID=UPI0037CC2973
MNDVITLRGFVASEVKSSTTIRGTSTASFRLGTTERRYDRANNTWVDGNTNWYTVQSFRYLAGHVGCSLKKGQRVIVVGRLRLRQWEHEGKIYHVAEVDAEAVGHDLMWGSANFTRMSATSPAPEVAPTDARSDLASGTTAPRLDGSSEDWESTMDGSTPPADSEDTSGTEGPEDPDRLLVNTETGELADAVA